MDNWPSINSAFTTGRDQYFRVTYPLKLHLYDDLIYSVFIVETYLFLPANQ